MNSAADARLERQFERISRQVPATRGFLEWVRKPHLHMVRIPLAILLILGGVFSFLPDTIEDALVSFLSLFVGEGWNLTLGVIFVLLVIFMPGGIIEGLRRLWVIFTRKRDGGDAIPAATHPQPAE